MGGFNQLNVNNSFPVKSSKLEPCNGRKAIAIQLSLGSVLGPADPLTLSFIFTDNFGSLQGIWYSTDVAWPIQLTIQSTGQVLTLPNETQGYLPILGVDSSQILVEIMEEDGEFGPSTFTLFLLNYTPDPIVWPRNYTSGGE
jgi:hypothetical protein